MMNTLVMQIGFEYIIGLEGRGAPEGERFSWLPIQEEGAVDKLDEEENGSLMLAPYLSRRYLASLVALPAGSGINGVPFLNASPEWLTVISTEFLDPATGVLGWQDAIGKWRGIKGSHHGSMSLTRFKKLIEDGGGTPHPDTAWLQNRLEELVKWAYRKSAESASPLHQVYFRIPYFFTCYAAPGVRNFTDTPEEVTEVKKERAIVLGRDPRSVTV